MKKLQAGKILKKLSDHALLLGGTSEYASLIDMFAELINRKFNAIKS